MRPINKLPTHHQIDDELAGEIMDEWRAQAQRAGMNAQYHDLVKLAYKLGYQRCANLHFV